MISLNVHNNKKQHFIIRSDEPVRIEVITTSKGEVIAHVYEGIEDDQEQEPLFLYDGTIKHENKSWEKSD